MNVNKTNNLQRDLAGKVAIVTSTASGIGLAIAKLLKQRDVFVVAEDINHNVNEVFKDHLVGSIVMADGGMSVAI